MTSPRRWGASIRFQADGSVIDGLTALKSTAAQLEPRRGGKRSLALKAAATGSSNGPAFLSEDGFRSVCRAPAIHSGGCPAKIARGQRSPHAIVAFRRIVQSVPGHQRTRRYTGVNGMRIRANRENSPIFSCWRHLADNGLHLGIIGGRQHHRRETAGPSGSHRRHLPSAR